MEPTHPDRLVENVTAPSAGGFPGPDGTAWLGKRMPFRSTTSERSSEKVFGSGWGGIPQRSQRAQRCIGRGERDLHRSRFQQLPWSIESVSLKKTPKK